jgi:hypothetical protein
MKAKETAKRLNIESFGRAVDNWNCSGQGPTKFSDSFLVKEQQCTWKQWKSKLQNELREYPPDNQSNARETGLFY